MLTIAVYDAIGAFRGECQWVSKAYGKSKTKTLLLTLLLDVTVIDTTHNTAVMALHSPMDDVEDALQYFTALEHGMDVFLSRDKDLKKWALPSLPICNLQEFLAL